MRNLMAIVLILFALVAKAQYGEEVKVKVSGNIKNASSKTIILCTAHGTIIDKIAVNENGKFDENFMVLTDEYFLQDEKSNAIKIYLEKGVELHVDYDESDFKKTLKISGENVLKSQYKNESFSLFMSSMAGMNNMYQMPAGEFVDKIQEYYNASMDLLKKYKFNDKEFVAVEEGEIHYMRFGLVDQYAEAYQKDLPEDIKKLRNDVDVNNELLYKRSLSYGSFIYNMCAYHSNKLIDENKVNDGHAMLDFVAKTIDNEYIKNRVLKTWWGLAINGAKDKKALFDKFMALSNDKEVQGEVKKKFKEISKFDKGKPSPVFKNYPKYGGGTVSLEDFRGKYVYIDFWASWCGACIKQFPYLLELEKEYHDKNIVFVGISLDQLDLKDKWEKLVAKHGLKGVQLLADEAMDSNFSKAYNIITLPRFILLDPQGNIVDADAPRPSEPELKTLLNSLSL